MYGNFCCSTRGKETADKLVALLKEKIHALKIAPATDETAEMGPLITAEAQKRVLDFISTGEEEGAEVVCDGRGFTPPAGCEQGFFVGGTLLDKVTSRNAGLAGRNLRPCAFCCPC